MRESKLYLNFFRKNLLFFILLPLMGLLISYFIYLQRPIFYEYSRLYQLSYTPENIPQKIAETDEVVSQLRSNHLQQNLGITSRVTVFKPGPVSVNMTTNSIDQNLAKKELEVLTDYLKSSHQVSQIGQDIFRENRPTLFSHLFIGLLVGLFFGLLISLVKTYLERY